jgi:hypothetical protein
VSEYQSQPHVFTLLTVDPGDRSLADLETVLRQAGLAALASEAEAGEGTYRARLVSDAEGSPLRWTSDGWLPISHGTIAEALAAVFGADVSVNNVVYDGAGHPTDDTAVTSFSAPLYDAFAWLTTAADDLLPDRAATADQPLLVVPSSSPYYESLVVALESPSRADDSNVAIKESSLAMWRHGSRRGFVVTSPLGVLGDDWDDTWVVVDPSAGAPEVLAAIDSIRTASPIEHYAEIFILDEVETERFAALLAAPASDTVLHELCAIVGEPRDIADVVEGRVDATTLPGARLIAPREVVEPQGLFSGLASFARSLTRDRRFD